MKEALFEMVTLLLVAAIIVYASRTFLPDPFNKVATFVAGIVTVIAVVGFLAFLLGVSNPFPL